MKRIGSITLIMLLASCLLASCSSAPAATPTKSPGELSLDMPSVCLTMEEGLCIVSPPGASFGGGKTTVIKQKPTAAFLNDTSAIQIKVGDWTLVFDPGESTPFSVGMTFPNAKLYPQGNDVGMAVEENGNKCDPLEGEFVDDILQTAQSGEKQINPISGLDIRFSMRCNGEPLALQGRVKLSQ